EARAIADATAKANAAKAYADAQDVLLKAQADAYADGKVTAEEQARIDQAQTNLNAAKQHAQQVADQAQQNANNHTDQQVSVLQGLLDVLKQKTGIDALPSGKTIINGGQIDTDLLNAVALRALVISAGLITASEIDVQSLFAQAITATNLTVTGSSKVGQYVIQDFSLIGDGDRIAGIRSMTTDQKTTWAFGRAFSAASYYSNYLGVLESTAQRSYSIGLYINIQNGSYENLALDIPNGGIRVGGSMGYSGKFSIPSFNNVYYHFKYINGLLVGVVGNTNPTNPL
ncbi:hypothetical protein, partial [Sphingobacterium multivorum]